MRKKNSPGASASRRDFLVGSAGGAFAASALPSMAAAQGAAAPSVDTFLTPQAMGALGDGRTDDGEALQRTVDAAFADGRPIHVPAGTYRIGRPIRIRAANYLAFAGSFAPGPRISGAGSGLTVFEAAGGAALFDLDSGSDHRSEFRAALGGLFEGFTIRAGSSGGGAGIKLRSAYAVKLRDLHITGLAGTGVEIECLAGDLDGSNMVSLEQVRIENCGGWGVDAGAAPGFNEISYLKLDQVFVQNCGTASSSQRPESGGMRWKGQICTLEQCGFALNQNCGLYIPGEAGLGQTIDIRNTGFENNRGRHLLCTGITAFKARNLQFYSNDQFRVATACEFDGSRNTVRFVDIEGVVVRATAGNRPYTAFRIGGGNAELDRCRVRNVVWENFDFPGQARFDGWLFDHVAQCCELRPVSATEAVFGPSPTAGRGNKTPLRLRGGNARSPSATGEWVEAAIPSGLVLRNSGLGASRRYNVYLFDDANVKRLEAATEAPLLDPVSGYLVKDGDPTRLFVGSVETDGSGRFAV